MHLAYVFDIFRSFGYPKFNFYRMKTLEKPAMPQTIEGIKGKDLLGLELFQSQATIEPDQVYQITLRTNDERLAELRGKIQVGLDQIDRGETVGMDEVFSKARKIINKAKNEEV